MFQLLGNTACGYALTEAIEKYIDVYKRQYEMYEDFKETMVKAIKTELSAKHNQSTDTDLPQRIEQIVHSEQEQQRAIITQLAERLESIERSNANTHNGICLLYTSRCV